MKALVAAAALALTLASPLAAHAHRAWLLPSATVLSGKDLWVAVDAAISNDLFYFEHNPVRLDALAITGPDGAAIAPVNASTSKFRSSFDVPLAQPGTYKIAVVNNIMAAIYQDDSGETKRWRGSPEAFSREVPANAKNLQTSRTQSRTETFVTAGKPSDRVLQPTGVGLELVPMTHPNDLVQGEAATFRLLRDGKPAADVQVAVVPGGIRYRDNLKEMNLSTDAEGKFTVTFPDPGMYWIGASVRSEAPRPAPAASAPAAGAHQGHQMGNAPAVAPAPAAPGAPAPPPFRPGERAIYGVTLEVMAK